MGLSIKSTAVEERIRELAELTGESLTRAVEVAVEERLARLRPASSVDDERAALDALIAEVAQLPVLDARSPDEIIGYDESGLP